MNIRSGTCSHGGRRLWISGGEILFSDFWQIMKMYKCAVLVYIYAKQRLWECRIWDEASVWMEICDFWPCVCMSLIFNSMQICFSASVLPWMFPVDVWYIVPFFLNIYSKNKRFCTKAAVTPWRVFGLVYLLPLRISIRTVHSKERMPILKILVK